tara:strand:- start:412 stop:696 length:285 start_codon:yes stop_codon:yes gene_type:complete
MANFERMNDGSLYKYSSIGCYPLFYLAADNGVLCPDCANEADQDPDIDTTDKDDPQWCLVACDANWEDPALYCDHCGERIESAYADDGDNDNDN